MKRNKLFLLGLFVVFAAVLSLSLVSSTFAKYTSSDDGSDTARVAKWGVTIDVQHDEDAKTVTDTLTDADETHISVVKESKLLAPGTKGSLLSASVTGQPEVALNVTVNFTLTLSDWSVGGAEYMPLVFKATINGANKTYKIGDGTDEYATIAALTAAIKADLEANNGEKAADFDLANKFDFALSWEWAFEGDNAKDTALGNATTAPTMTIEYEILVVQID